MNLNIQAKERVHCIFCVTYSFDKNLHFCGALHWKSKSLRWLDKLACLQKLWAEPGTVATEIVPLSVTFNGRSTNLLHCVVSIHQRSSVISRNGSSLHLRRILQKFKMLGYFYGDIVGLEEGASGRRSDRQCRRRISKGDKFNKAAPAQQAPSPAPAAPAPATEENDEWRLLSQAAVADEK